MKPDDHREHDKFRENCEKCEHFRMTILIGIIEIRLRRLGLI